METVVRFALTIGGLQPRPLTTWVHCHQEGKKKAPRQANVSIGRCYILVQEGGKYE